MDHASVVPKVAYQFSYDITDCFSKERVLGTGAFGKVYLGVHEDGKKTAVKLINPYTGFNDEQFQNEFKYLSRLEHKNIVRLLSYCQETQEKFMRHKGEWVLQNEIQRALCLEYMPNGSLDKYISEEHSGHDWCTLYAIIEGICKGLKYLHEELESPVYHLDLKPANILLDENMTPKIADFGMSRLFGEERTRITQNFKGTFGYLPPEYIEKNEISNKLDIFSLGVIMLKLMAGRTGHSKSMEMPSQQFVELVHEIWSNKLLQEALIDVLELESCYKHIKGCIGIALRCVNVNRHNRPTIGEIVNELNELKARTQLSDESVNSPGSSMDQGNSNLDNTIVGPKKLAFHLLEEMTNGFSEDQKLGGGNFANVYMGVQKCGKRIVVKMLHPTLGLDDEQFQKEYDNLASLQHPNIVQFIGYCLETQREQIEYKGKMFHAEVTHRAFCFEYLQNGSLQKYLADEFSGHDWYTRYRIIKGICKGLAYLHEELNPPIIHMDLKPATILLDENMLPKIADFELSKLFGQEQTRTTLGSVETLVHLPPEYKSQNLISRKLDIFSLGVLIMNIIVGPTSYSKISEMSPEKFIQTVHKNWRMRLHATLVDALESYCEQVKRCTEIAMSCVEVDRRKRPKIGDIVKKLNETEIMIEFRYELENDAGSSMNQDISNMDHESVVARRIPFHLLEQMTDGFSPERLLGMGGYGKVYLGVQKDGRYVAVKVLHEILGLKGDEQFEMECGNLQNLQHQNIVRVVGYCYESMREYVPYEARKVLAESTHRAICFEYMPSGSLDKCLHDESTGNDWETRYDIIKGICDGLNYLHEELETPIYHLDLKPANVLLDEYMKPKITDFGLARVFGENTRVTKSSVGTHGYLPPEYIERGIISNKFDIFSLGVVIIKIIAGPRGYTASAEMSSHEFMEIVFGKWRNRLQAASGYMLGLHSAQIRKCLEIALSCLEPDRHKRPSIGEIVHMLNEVDLRFRHHPSSLLDQ